MAEARLIQIYYKDEQKSSCFPFADLYFNERLTIFFENEVISKLVTASQDEKIAVCSWKLKDKLKWNIGRPRKLSLEVLNTDYDVLSFTRNTKHHQMLNAADKWHPGFKSTMKKLCDIIGLKMPGEVKIPIYQNHFSAKTEIYQDYVNNFLKPAMEAMSFNDELRALSMADSHYSELDRATTERLDNLERQIGIRYYPLAPFILERLFSIYVQNKKINVTHL